MAQLKFQFNSAKYNLLGATFVFVHLRVERKKIQSADDYD